MKTIFSVAVFMFCVLALPALAATAEPANCVAIYGLLAQIQTSGKPDRLMAATTLNFDKINYAGRKQTLEKKYPAADRNKITEMENQYSKDIAFYSNKDEFELAI